MSDPLSTAYYMEVYARPNHAVHGLPILFVWITIHRKIVLRGPIATRLPGLISDICKFEDIGIFQGNAYKDQDDQTDYKTADIANALFQLHTQNCGVILIYLST